MRWLQFARLLQGADPPPANMEYWRGNWCSANLGHDGYMADCGRMVGMGAPPRWSKNAIWTAWLAISVAAYHFCPRIPVDYPKSSETAMTDKSQRLRNEVGQLTHNLQRMIDQRREMQADLVGQRQDMLDALEALEVGSVRDAMAILRDGLERRERTREQRKVKV